MNEMESSMHVTQPSPADMFDDLQKLIAVSGNSNRHELVNILIQACLSEGIDTRSEIIASITPHGFKSSHIAIVLKEDAGTDRARHWWHRDALGRYHILA